MSAGPSTPSSSRPGPHRPLGPVLYGVRGDWAGRRSRRRRRQLRTGLVAAVIVGILVLALGGAATPAARARVTLPATLAAAQGSAAPATLPWAPTGQSAVYVPLVGLRAQSGPEAPVPVASLTKIMTAYVVLRDHPLRAGQGPSVALTAADVANFGTDTVTDQANVEFKAGEVLTEYQMLEGLLVHSANDLAYALAVWDAGSVTAFVAKMNADARALGMSATHFADASGYLPASQSTAADMLRAAGVAMQIPTFARIVTMPSVTLPVAGTVGSFTPLLDTPGVAGVKSGFTAAAGGCDVLAYRVPIGGRTLTVLAAVTSQEGPTVIETAGKEALAIAVAAAGRVTAVTVAPAGRVVGRVGIGGASVAVTTAAPVRLLVLPGTTVHQRVRLLRPPAQGVRRGERMGTAVFTAGPQTVSVPVRTAGALP